MSKYYEYTHIVGFEETNLVGNVYFANYPRWQGRCREMFLYEKAPEVIEDVRGDLKLFTLKVSCDFHAELTAFDEISIRMSLRELGPTQLELGFEYVHLSPQGEVLAATGTQRIACMRGENRNTQPTRVPPALVAALAPYQAS